MKSIVAFGEILMRLSPEGNGRICGADSFSVCYGGTESNVLVTLSAFGHSTQYVSVVPDNAFGKAVEQHLNKYKVGTRWLLKQGEVLGEYYLEKGFGNRPTTVIYNRKNSEIAKKNSKLFTDMQYDEIFENCELFHISGISFGLSKGCRELSYRMIDEAKKRAIPVSFDCNYRAKVWGKYPAKEYRKIIDLADIIFCSQKDLDAMKIDDCTQLLSRGNCKYLVIREKEMTDFNAMKAWCTTLFLEKGEIKKYTSRTVAFDVLESIGGGDVFNAGMLHFLLEEKPDLVKAMDFALACYVV